MKNRNILGFALFSRLWNTPIFILFIALFICGGIAGSITGQLTSINDTYIIKSFADTIEESAKLAPTFLDAVKAMLSALSWQILIIALGLLKPAGLFICMALTIRGFILAFSASALFGALGAKGILISLCSSGLTWVVTVPCLITSAVACYMSAKQAPKGKRLSYFYVLKSQRAVLFVCILISMWASALKLPIAYLILHI